MEYRPVFFSWIVPLLTGAAVCLIASHASAGPIVNDFPSPEEATTCIPASYEARDVFYSRHSAALADQGGSLTTEDTAALLVLFLPWTESTPVPPPPGNDGNGNNGGTTPTSGSGNNGNGNNGGSSGKGTGPGDPGGDPSGGSGNTLHSTPEPTSMLSGVLGAAMVALFGWRKRRHSGNRSF